MKKGAVSDPFFNLGLVQGGCPCLRGGTCTSNNTCICPSGTGGSNCGILTDCFLYEAYVYNLNGTAIDACENGGLCQTTSGKCVCPQYYNGTACESMIDFCNSSPCANGATCSPILGSYNCTCQPGYIGPTCNEIANVCASSPCENGGLCQQTGVNAFTCNCSYGWSGSNCSIPVDLCTSNPCSPNSVCVPGFGSFSCNCNSGYSGTLCNTSKCNTIDNYLSQQFLRVDHMALAVFILLSIKPKLIFFLEK